LQLDNCTSKWARIRDEIGVGEGVVLSSWRVDLECLSTEDVPGCDIVRRFAAIRSR